MTSREEDVEMGRRAALGGKVLIKQLARMGMSGGEVSSPELEQVGSADLQRKGESAPSECPGGKPGTHWVEGHLPPCSPLSVTPKM